MRRCLSIFLYFPAMRKFLSAFFPSFSIRNILHPVGILSLLVGIGLPFWVYLAPNEGMKEWVGNLDLKLPFWLFGAQLALGLVLFAVLAQDFGSWLRSRLPSRNYAIALGAVVAVALFVAVAWIEPRHRVQSDESIFLTTAQNMYHDQAAGACDEGSFKATGLDCTRTSHNFKAKGLAFLYAVGMPFFGEDMQWVFNFQLLLLLATLPLFFLALKAWTQDDFLSLLATAILAAQPTLLFQFRAASVEPLYVLLSAMALLFLKWAYDRNSVRHWVLLALVLAFFAQTRQETPFCFGAFLIVALPRLLGDKDLRAPAFIATLSYFSLPVLLTISYYQGYNFQGGEFAAHGHFFEHLRSNWDVLASTPMQGDLLGNPFLPSLAWLTLAGTITLVVLAVRDLADPARRFVSLWPRVLAFLVLYHMQTYMILENVSGDFSIEINQRYILVMLPTMAFLGALFLRQASLVLAPMLMGIARPALQSKAAFAVVAVLLALVLGNTLRYGQSFRENIMYNRNHLTTEEHEILKWVRSQDNKPRLFIYARPWHFIGYGYSSRHYDAVSRLSGEEMRRILDEYHGEVYYIRGLDCWDSQTYHRKAVEHRIATVCDQFEERFDIEPVFQTTITGNYLLTVAKIADMRDYDRQGVFVPGIFHWFPENKTVQLSYALAAQGKPWKIAFSLNGSPVSARAYHSGEFLDTLSADKMLPGYNSWEIRVDDTTNGKPIYRGTQRRFFGVDGVVPMVRLQPVESQQAWGELKVGRSVLGNPLTVAGVRYDDGVGTHAAARLRYDLQGKFKRFTAVLGIDDEEMCSDGIRVQISADGRLLSDSGPIKPGEAKPVSLDIAGAKILTIEADSLADKNCDHLDLLEGALHP